MWLLRILTWPLEVFARATNWCGYNDSRQAAEHRKQQDAAAQTEYDARWEEQKKAAHERQGK